jgi:DNA-binding response OmpR family regulator
VFPRPAGLADITARALDDLGEPGRLIIVDIPDDDLPEVLADPGLLERVIANLAGNALRYAPAGHPPRLTASALGGRVELSVIDQGPGIPAADRDAVFTAFQRLGDTDNTTGVGLGLALSRGLIEAMGGTLVRHPRRRAHHDPVPGRRGAGGPAGAGGTGRRMTRVLVVDDEPQIVRALRINLRVRQYDVTTAANGAQALAEAARHPPDVVILDLGLPDLDGVEVIAGLRGWTSAPIIVLSGRADSTDKVQALDAGADDYVTKPFAMDELLARIRAVSRRGTADGELPQVRIGDLVVDLAAKRVSRAGDGADAIRLTPTEWHLLTVLLRHPGKLLSQRQLLQEVWGPGYADATGNLRLYMAQLRRKLEPDPARPRWLITEPGMGYRFQPGPEHPDATGGDPPR